MCHKSFFCMTFHWIRTSPWNISIFPWTAKAKIECGQFYLSSRSSIGLTPQLPTTTEYQVIDSIPLDRDVLVYILLFQVKEGQQQPSPPWSILGCSFLGPPCQAMDNILSPQHLLPKSSMSTPYHWKWLMNVLMKEMTVLYSYLSTLYSPRSTFQTPKGQEIIK